ncbi:hypothetical protein [Actinomycetospora sp. CA-053990]|uniref:hypothetical protein n=1 Tax=Actinomycetospora sp. CA-053990 TaxID=3239891 RepID=UPI003D8FF50A
MPEHPNRLLVLVAAVALATVVVAGCAAGPPAAGSPVGAVGFLDAVIAQSPLEDGQALVTLPASMSGSNLLVAVAMGDGPGPGEVNAEAQHTHLIDSAGHLWNQREHHIVFGSIIDVYTAPANGREQGSTLSSELIIKGGDEGHCLTVLAYRNGRFHSTTSRNGNFGIPQLMQDAPAGADVLTAFGDGRENTPATPVTGFRPLNILPVDGGPRGDRDLYQLNRLDPPGSWPGGGMLTGNLAPQASGYWGLVNINITPAS